MRTLLKLVAGGLLLALAMPALSAVPAAAWNEDRLTWTAPTTCSDGSPIANCPITGYRIETARTATATTWTTQATVSVVVAYIATNRLIGQNCYRIFTLTAAGESLTPSNIACTNTVGLLPGPPTNLLITDQAIP